MKRDQIKPALDLSQIEQQRLAAEIRNAPIMSLSGGAISDQAAVIVDHLYHQVMAHRALTMAKSHRKSKANFQQVIGGIVAELLSAHSKNYALGWMKVSVRRIRASQLGVSEPVFLNILNALSEEGFVDRFVGYAGLELNDPGARRGRATRIRATNKLVELCAHQRVTLQEVSTHLRTEQEKAPDDAGAF